MRPAPMTPMRTFCMANLKRVAAGHPGTPGRADCAGRAATDSDPPAALKPAVCTRSCTSTSRSKMTAPGGKYRKTPPRSPRTRAAERSWCPAGGGGSCHSLVPAAEKHRLPDAGQAGPPGRRTGPPVGRQADSEDLRSSPRGKAPDALLRGRGCGSPEPEAPLPRERAAAAAAVSLAGSRT